MVKYSNEKIYKDLYEYEYDRWTKLSEKIICLIVIILCLVIIILWLALILIKHC